MIRHDVLGLIPHQPPMLFIDSVGFDQGRPKAFTQVKPDWLILTGDNEVAGPAFFELMAQGFAGICALQTKEGGALEENTATLGFLVGVKNITIVETARPGDALEVRFGPCNWLGPVCVFDAQVCRESGELLASGQIKIFLTDGSMAENGMPAGLPV